MNKFPPIKGMHDNFSPKTDQLRSLEAILINSAEKLGYNEVRTPILENLNLFKKTIGSDSDIVEKEMFTFNTSKDDVIALRPEGTCATARFVANNDLNDQINKFWYLGPFLDMKDLRKEDIDNSISLVLNYLVQSLCFMKQNYFC